MEKFVCNFYNTDSAERNVYVSTTDPDKATKELKRKGHKVASIKLIKEIVRWKVQFPSTRQKPRTRGRMGDDTGGV